jgi:Subtilase family/Peptidase inhibitor I9
MDNSANDAGIARPVTRLARPVTSNRVRQSRQLHSTKSLISPQSVRKTSENGRCRSSSTNDRFTSRRAGGALRGALATSWSGSGCCLGGTLPGGTSPRRPPEEYGPRRVRRTARRPACPQDSAAPAAGIGGNSVRISFSSGRRAAAVVAALVAAGLPGLATPAQAAPATRTAVIVQLDAGASTASTASLAVTDGGRVRHVYRTVLNGFAGEFSDRAIAALRRNPHVLSIEPDGTAAADITQANPPSWGLDRIDQRKLPLSNSYTYDPNAGAGVTAYVLDTGIDPGAQDLQGRIGAGTSFVPDANGTRDCNGHGTHVAGTIGGSSYGVAKAVTVVPVRVIDCAGSGTLSSVIAGLDWVALHASRPAVANLSLGGAASSAVDAAVQHAIDSGVTVSVAAGNSDANACNISPARVAGALTVGATDRTDRRAPFSNFGRCVDLFAPGVNITSDWLNGGTNTVSGTSMASPHVAGTAAVLLSQQPALKPAQVAARLSGSATTGTVDAPGKRSPNLLLYAPPTWPAP